jgi:single-strand DNA-binding protein
MSKDLNRCCFIGRLGQDVETRAMPDGTMVANLSLAVGDDYKDKSGNKVERTEWIRVSAFGRPAEVLQQYCSKGSKLYIEGKFTTRSYEKEGVKHYVSEIRLSEFQMLDNKQSDSAPQHQPAQQYRQPPKHEDGVVPAGDFDDIPFN